MPRSDKINVKDLVEIFFRAEETFDLLRATIRGTLFWPLSRVHIYTEIGRKLGLFEGIARGSRGPTQILRKSLTALHGTVAGNPLFRGGTYENIVFPHPRKIKEGERWIDPVAAPLLQELAGHEGLVVAREQPFSLGTKPTYGLPTVRREALDVLTWLAMHKKLSLTPEEDRLLKDVSAFITEKAGAGIEIKPAVERNLNKFRKQEVLFHRLFKKYSPKRIFIAVAYTNEGICSAAKKAGARVYELQHGLISPNHLGYSYPSGPDIPYFPDGILTFGQGWTEGVTLPRKAAVRVIGSKQHNKNNLSHKTSKGRIVFLSQPSIFENILSYCMEVAAMRPGSEIIFRLHPGQSDAELEMLNSKRSAIPKNVTFESGKTPLLETLATAEFQAGVYSTALIEGASIGCKTILLDIPGVEILSPLLPDAPVADTPQAFVKALRTAVVLADPDRFYAAPCTSILSVVEDMERQGSTPPV